MDSVNWLRIGADVMRAQGFPVAVEELDAAAWARVLFTEGMAAGAADVETERD